MYDVVLCWLDACVLIVFLYPDIDHPSSSERQTASRAAMLFEKNERMLQSSFHPIRVLPLSRQNREHERRTASQTWIQVGLVDIIKNRIRLIYVHRPSEAMIGSNAA